MDDKEWVLKKEEELKLIELYKQGKFDEIIKKLAHEISKSEFDVSNTIRQQIWNNLGIQFLRDGMLQRARDLYVRIVKILEAREQLDNKLYPKGTAYHNLGISFLRLRKKNQAKKYLSKAFLEDLIDTRGDLNEVRLRPAYRVFFNLFDREPELEDSGIIDSPDIKTTETTNWIYNYGGNIASVSGEGKFENINVQLNHIVENIIIQKPELEEEIKKLKEEFDREKRKDGQKTILEKIKELLKQHGPELVMAIEAIDKIKDMIF